MRKNRVENLLNIVFRISPQTSYDVKENGLVVIKEKQDRKIQKFFRKLGADIPEYRRIDLDNLSSFVFLQIDGRRTVREIGQALEKEYGDRVKPVYERLSMFLSGINNRYIERVR